MRARIVEHCRDYPWSSYRALSGDVASPEWLETNWLLSLFGEDRDTAKKRYRDFVESVENGKIENPSDDVVGGVVLGRDDFVNWVKKTFLSKDSNSKKIPQLKILKPRPTTDDLIQAVSDEFGCGMESILRKGKKSNLALDVAIYLCRQLTGETSVGLCRRFDICGAGIAARHDRIAKKLKTDRKLMGRGDRIRRKILNI